PASWLGVPIVAVSRTIGAVAMEGESPNALDDAALMFTRAVLAQAGIALENARLVELLSSGKREWEQTVDAFNQAICYVDPGRGGAPVRGSDRKAPPAGTAAAIREDVGDRPTDRRRGARPEQPPRLGGRLQRPARRGRRRAAAPGRAARGDSSGSRARLGDRAQPALVRAAPGRRAPAAIDPADSRIH